MNKKHIFLFVFVLLLDQVSKMVVHINMQLHESISIIPGFFQLTYLHNTGAAWSMFEGKRSFFLVISVVAFIAMLYFYKNSAKSDFLTRNGLILMMAGTVGNFIDRISLHYVRDFLNFCIFGYDFPVFNIADVALCVGVFLIVVSVFMDEFYGGVHTCEK